MWAISALISVRSAVIQLDVFLQRLHAQSCVGVKVSATRNAVSVVTEANVRSSATLAVLLLDAAFSFLPLHQRRFA